MSTEQVQIRRATTSDAGIVTDMVYRLLNEFGGFTEFDFDTSHSLCTELLADEQHYAALLARNLDGEVLGVLTLAECTALYVAGRLGWIQELYVVPEARSLGVGHELIAAATEYARARGWKRLEVNTPDVNVWARTVSFYLREGFEGNSRHLRKYP